MTPDDFHDLIVYISSVASCIEDVRSAISAFSLGMWPILALLYFINANVSRIATALQDRDNGDV